MYVLFARLASDVANPHLHVGGNLIHGVHILIGVGIGVVVLLPLGIIMYRKSKRRHSAVTSLVRGQIRREQLKSDIILNAIEDGVLVVDENHTIQLFNPGAATLTGWSIDEAVGVDVFSVMRLVDDKNVEYGKEQNPLFRVYGEKKALHDNHATLVSRSQKRIPISLSVSPLISVDGKVSGAVGIFRDSSAERNEEQRRAEFISTASHEMRTPVAAIEGYLALALNPNVSHIDSKAKEFLEKAHASTQHLGKLFQDLLTSAKAEDGRLSNHPMIIEMSSFLEQLVDGLRFAAEKKGLKLEFVVGDNAATIDATGGSKVIKPLYYVQVDPDRIREVVVNLFDNAVKYTDAGKVSIGVTGDNQVVQLRISDTGVGIPPEDIPHLFQKFYRVDNSATRTVGGSGLGLFICRKIVELYNGRIWVESELNKGTTFYINLPRVNNQAAQQIQTKEVAQAPVLPVSAVPGS